MKITYMFSVSEYSYKEYTIEIPHVKLNAILNKILKKEYPDISNETIDALLGDVNERDTIIQAFKDYIKEEYEEEAKGLVMEAESYNNVYAYHGVSRND